MIEKEGPISEVKSWIVIVFSTILAYAQNYVSIISMQCLIYLVKWIKFSSFLKQFH